MDKLLKRAVGKIARIFMEASQLSRLMLFCGPLPDLSEAMSCLQSISTDVGKSCWVDENFEYRNRTCKLSVIVPAYNVEKYIDHCLESILRQQVTFDYEVIVVNDGSTDSTPARLEKYKKNERIHIIHQKNGGLSAARNTGISCSKGEYLCFVDSDDELPNGAFEQMMAVALQKQAKLVAGSYEKVLRSGTVLYTGRLKDQKADSNSLPGFAWGKMIHHSVFQNLKFPEGYWFEDSVMAQIVHPLCQDAIYTVSNVSYKYYSNEAGITATARTKPKALDSLWITMRLLEDRKKYSLSSTQASYAYFLSMVSLTYHRTKHLGVQTARSIFVVQRMLMDQYYCGYQIEDDRKKLRIQEALRENNFRKYVLACILKR